MDDTTLFQLCQQFEQQALQRCVDEAQKVTDQGKFEQCEIPFNFKYSDHDSYYNTMLRVIESISQRNQLIIIGRSGKLNTLRMMAIHNTSTHDAIIQRIKRVSRYYQMIFHNQFDVPQASQKVGKSHHVLISNYESQRPTYDQFFESFNLHDEEACAALMQYERDAEAYDCKHYEQIPTKHGTINGRLICHPLVKRPRISDYAYRYGTTIEAMKKHWRCVEAQINQNNLKNN